MKSVGQLRRSITGRAGRPWRALPHFVIVGAQKAGTTSVYHWLSRHRGVVPARRKELHYFDAESHRSLGWYREQFPFRKDLRPGRITGEASPSYMFYPHAIRRMAQSVPDTKVIAILRDPVRRAISHYHHQVRLEHEHLPLREALRADVEEERIADLMARMKADPDLHDLRVRQFSYRARGVYEPQLVELTDHYARENILVLIAEEAFAAPLDTLRRLETFLGLEPDDLGEAIPKRNAGDYGSDIDDDVIDDLTGYFAPHTRKLERWLGRAVPWPGGTSAADDGGART